MVIYGLVSIHVLCAVFILMNPPFAKFCVSLIVQITTYFVNIREI